MAYPPKIKPGGSIPQPEGPPYPSSVIASKYADCSQPSDENYQIFGMVEGNEYAKHFVAQWLEVPAGGTLTGFGIKIAKRGNPDEPLVIGLTLGGPPDDPMNPSQYVEQWQVPSSMLFFPMAWYWIQCYLETPIQVTTASPMVVAVSNTDYDPDTKTGDYIWGTCNGVPTGLNAATEYIPETLGLIQLPSAEPCQGPGHNTFFVDGVDMVDSFVFDPDTNIQVNNVITGEYYGAATHLSSVAVVDEGYTLDFYWDSNTELFGCYEGHLQGDGWPYGPTTGTVYFYFTMPSMSTGLHTLKIKMRQKPDVAALEIPLFVFPGSYDWYACPDTVSFFSYIAGTQEPCTNPTGSPGDWYCDGTTKKTCTNGVWVPTPNSPDCQAEGCINPTGINGATNCFGTTLYRCENGSWNPYIQNAIECAGCTCGNLIDPETCEGAKGSQGEQCCYWYQKHLWESPRCYSTPQDYLRDYLPFIAIGAGAAILLIALSVGRKTQYIQPYAPEEPETKKKGRK